MEQVKLTIRVPQDLLEGAKHYADQHQTSLTRLIAEYLRRLMQESDPLAEAPIVQRLTGILAPDASIEDYRRYLEQKYDSKA